MRVLGISGSLRRDSYNTALLRHAGDLFEADGAKFEIYRGLRESRPTTRTTTPRRLPRPSRESARRSATLTPCSSSPLSTTPRFLGR
jgi:NAD(P)H-dependent FMN reductase